MRKKIAGVVVMVVAALCLSAYFLLYYKPFSLNGTTYLYIDADDNADSVRVKLMEVSGLRRPRCFSLLASLCSYSVKTGRYAVSPDDDVVAVLRRLRTGAQTPVRITVPSVRTMPQLAAVLADKLMLDSASLASFLTDSASCAALGYDTATILALFIPDTYEVWWNTPAEGFLRRMQRERDAFWNKERRNKAESIGLSSVEVATLASIVDEETNDKAEKPAIAGLYINRLHKGMLLQADPTVKYALHDFSLRRILRKHLETDSPYNTYLYTGLPPGPIRIASIEGIDAVLNYERHDYLYMCAKDDFSGTHNFARTFREHQANARRYARALNKRGIR